MDALGIIVRPLAALALFGSAALLAWWLKRFIPEGRIKRILYKPEHVTDPKSNAFWYLLVATIVQFAIIFWFLSR